MTLSEAVSAFRALRPCAFEDAEVARWIAEADMRVNDGIVRDAEYVPPAYGQGDPELLAGAPYDSLYIHYASAMADYFGGDYGDYSNSMAMFNSVYEAFARRHARTEIPEGAQVRNLW